MACVLKISSGTLFLEYQCLNINLKGRRFYQFVVNFVYRRFDQPHILFTINSNPFLYYDDICYYIIELITYIADNTHFGQNQH